MPLIVAGARKLKRVLADEQNEVLDALRRREPVRDARRPRAVGRRAGRPLRRRITAELIAAAEAGRRRRSPASRPIDLGPTGRWRRCASQLAADLVAPLRERLERGVADGDGDNDAIAKRVRGVYREWKTQRIDEQLDDLFRLAYGRGASAAVAAGHARARGSSTPTGRRRPTARTTPSPAPSTIGERVPVRAHVRRRCTPAAAASCSPADR